MPVCDRRIKSAVPVNRCLYGEPYDPVAHSFTSKMFYLEGYRHAEVGFVYATNRMLSVPYDQAYFEKYVGYSGTEIANRINQVRRDMVVGVESNVFDVGIGCGEFLDNVRPFMDYIGGYDVNPVGVEWLKNRCIFHNLLDPYDQVHEFSGWTFWDVLEHLPMPEKILKRVPSRAKLYTSLPIYETFDNLENSHHFWPNEHYIYFTKNGFVAWMDAYGFDLMYDHTRETDAGRDSIGSFAFVKR